FGVAAVAVDGDRLGVHHRAAVVEREDDRPGRIEAACECCQIGQGHGRPAERDRGQVRGGGERGARGGDCRLLADPALVDGGVVVAIAAVDGGPAGGGEHGAAAGEGKAGRGGGVAVALGGGRW